MHTLLHWKISPSSNSNAKTPTGSSWIDRPQNFVRRLLSHQNFHPLPSSGRQWVLDGDWPVAISGNSRIFVQGVPILFWKNFKLFQSISSVSVNTSWNSKFGFKKKKILKTKTNLHYVHRKTSKGKKMKIKEMNKGTCTINYNFIWNINKIINYYCLVS